jgi:hypothetical protein
MSADLVELGHKLPQEFIKPARFLNAVGRHQFRLVEPYLNLLARIRTDQCPEYPDFDKLDFLLDPKSAVANRPPHPQMAHFELMYQVAAGIACNVMTPANHETPVENGDIVRDGTLKLLNALGRAANGTIHWKSPKWSQAGNYLVYKSYSGYETPTGSYSVVSFSPQMNEMTFNWYETDHPDLDQLKNHTPTLAVEYRSRVNRNSNYSELIDSISVHSVPWEEGPNNSLKKGRFSEHLGGYLGVERRGVKIVGGEFFQARKLQKQFMDILGVEFVYT